MANANGTVSHSMRISHSDRASIPIELQLFQGVLQRHEIGRRILGTSSAFPSTRKCDSYTTFVSFSDGTTEIETHYLREPSASEIERDDLPISNDELPEKLAWKELYLQGADGIAEPTLSLDQLSPEDRQAFEEQVSGPSHKASDTGNPSKRSVKKQARIAAKKESRKAAIAQFGQALKSLDTDRDQYTYKAQDGGAEVLVDHSHSHASGFLMNSDSSKTSPSSGTRPAAVPAHHRPLVVGLRKPASLTNIMASSEQAAILNKEIEQNVAANTEEAAPAEGPSGEAVQPKQKKEKAPKQPKPPKAAPAAAPTSPALIDLRVGHILRAIAHPNADSLYVSTIAMGDAEGTEHTQIDEETGKVVRTVCSGLNGLVPLSEMQNRKVVVVANLKPVNMRSIKSAAMVLAASPKPEEGADPHAHDRVVELVAPPEGSEAGDKVYFEGWPYGEGRGPEKTLNPKKKQWEAIQPGFYTSEDLVIGFDASQCDEVSGSDKGNLVVEGKGTCTVKTLKGAVVR